MTSPTPSTRIEAGDLIGGLASAVVSITVSVAAGVVAFAPLSHRRLARVSPSAVEVVPASGYTAVLARGNVQTFPEASPVGALVE